jgi:glycosyltransferase involved in cell wall biosynthesis
MPNLNQIIATSKKGNYFVYYGRISREKGINTLIKAFQNSSINLKIIGTGPLLDEYTNKKHQNIEFVGYKTGAELTELVSNASFIIVPSQWYENNPMTIVEGYSYGKPVIGANIGGIPEIIEDGKTGYLFESGNSDDLLSMVSKADSLSDKEYEKMSKNARQFAEDNFNPEIHYQQLMTIYKKVLAMN